MKQNAEDGGHRRFIMVEMETDIARKVTAERVRRVAEGYTSAKGKEVAGLGGGFRYATLDKPLFNAHHHINTNVTFTELAHFVWFTETGTPWQAPAKPSPLLGIHDGRAVYLLYNGILKDMSAGGGNVLTTPLLDEIAAHDGPKTVYGTRCMLKAPRLRELGITFKQLPYNLVITA